MVSDREVLAEVRAVLNAEVADVTAAPTLLAAVHRRHARRRLARRWALIATPLVAAAVAAAVVLPPTDVPTRDADRVDVAFVLESTSAALDAVQGHVIYERAAAGAGDKYFRPGEQGFDERWHSADGSAFRFRATVDGSPVVDLSRDPTADVFVDHRARTYRRGPGVPPGDPGRDDVWTPEEIRREIEGGHITVEGPGEPVDGAATVRLTVAAPKAGPATEMWVNADTYLPVRWRWAQEGASTFDVTWLPPTPENLAQLTTPIPPDFTENR